MAKVKIDARVYPLNQEDSKTKAFASVSLDGMVAIRGIRVVEGINGLFASMPQSYDKKTDQYSDIAVLLDKDVRAELNKAVRDEYKRVESLPPEQRGYNKPEAGGMNGLGIEDIKLDITVFNLKEQEGKLKAVAAVNVYDLVEIRGVRVFDGKNGLFVNMPQSKDKKTDEYHDVAFPINGDLRNKIKRIVLEKYENNDKAKGKSLEEGLKRGAEKAAERSAAPKEPAAKSRDKSIGA